jgi:hypothetical protein
MQRPTINSTHLYGAHTLSSYDDSSKNKPLAFYLKYAWLRGANFGALLLGVTIVALFSGVFASVRAFTSAGVAVAPTHVVVVMLFARKTSVLPSVDSSMWMEKDETDPGYVNIESVVEAVHKPKYSLHGIGRRHQCTDVRHKTGRVVQRGQHLLRGGPRGFGGQGQRGFLTAETNDRSREDGVGIGIGLRAQQQLGVGIDLSLGLFAVDPCAAV